jgi:hypothetical protein
MAEIPTSSATVAGWRELNSAVRRTRHISATIGQEKSDKNFARRIMASATAMSDLMRIVNIAKLNVTIIPFASQIGVWI